MASTDAEKNDGTGPGHAADTATSRGEASTPIEDYGIIGNTLHRRAGVARRLDRLAVPAAFQFGIGICGVARRAEARALADRAGEPAAGGRSRRYCGDTGILYTRFETAEGAVTVIDFMPLRRKARTRSIWSAWCAATDGQRANAYRDRPAVRLWAQHAVGASRSSAGRARFPARMRSSSSRRWRCTARPS